MAGRFSVESVFKAVDKVTKPVSKMQQSVLKFTRKTQRGLRTVNRALDKVVGGFARGAKAIGKFGGIALGGLATGVTLLVREFSKIEDAQAAFTPLLGGAEKAKAMVDALNETAATTPFQFEQLADSVNFLLPVMNGNIEETIKTVRMLGDTAGGSQDKLERISRGFSKAFLKGKVDMESLNMIGEAGVPIIQEFADTLGVTTQEVLKLSSAGKLTTTDLTKAFQKMTSEGGIFHNGMQIASKTTSGLFSTLKDNISLTAAEIGSALAPVIKDLIKETTEIAKQIRAWAKANREVIKARFIEFVNKAKKLAKAFWKTIQDLNTEFDLMTKIKNIITGISDAFSFFKEHGATIAKIIGGIVALSVVLKVLVGVMTLVNIVMAANPVTLIVLGIMALIAAVAALVIWWEEILDWFRQTGPVVDGIIVAISLLTGPIGWLTGAAALIIKHWEPIKGFFSDLWDGVVGMFNAAISKITAVVDRVRNAAAAIVDTIASLGTGVAEFFGFADEGEERLGDGSRRKTRQIVSPQARTAQLVQETRKTSTAEVTIKDETGRAEITNGSLGNGVNLIPSGAF